MMVEEIVMLSNNKQHKNALFPIIWIPLFSTTSNKILQQQNAPSPILMMVE